MDIDEARENAATLAKVGANEVSNLLPPPILPDSVTATVVPLASVATPIPYTVPALVVARRTKQLRALTSLRFAAAAMVVMEHSSGLFGFPLFPWWRSVLLPGVSFFYILSGFILTYTYPTLDGPQSARRFWRARFARIWPAHVAAFLLFVALIPFAFIRHTYPPLSVLLNLLLLQSWVPALGYLDSFNSASWSLAVEVAFYLSFPFFIRHIRRRWAFLLIGALLVSATVALIANGNLVPLPSGVNHSMLAVEWPPTRFFEFILGMATAVAWERFGASLQWGRRVGTLIEAGVFFLVIGVLLSTGRVASAAETLAWVGAEGHNWISFIGFAALPFALLIFTMALERGEISRVLSLPVCVLLGEISYSVYLFHAVLVSSYHYFHPGITRWLPNWAAFLGFWSTTLVLSYVVWAVIEMPGRRFLLGVGTRNRAGATMGTRRVGFFAPSWRYGAVSALLLLIPIGYIASVTATQPLNDRVRTEGHVRANIEAINGQPFSGVNPILTWDAGTPQALLVQGWAAPFDQSSPAQDAYLSLDGHNDILLTFGILRSDVAVFFHDPGNRALIYSGFQGNIPLEYLTEGQHSLTIKLVPRGTKTYFESPPTVFTVQGTPPSRA